MQTNTVISIKTNVDVKSVTKFNVVQNLNEHAYLYFEGVLNPECKDKYALENDSLKTVEILRDDTREGILFKGCI